MVTLAIARVGAGRIVSRHEKRPQRSGRTSAASVGGDAIEGNPLNAEQAAMFDREDWPDERRRVYSRGRAGVSPAE